MHALIAYGTLFNFTSIFVYGPRNGDLRSVCYKYLYAISFALATTFFLPASTVALQQRNTISVCDILLRSGMVCPFTTRLTS